MNQAFIDGQNLYINTKANGWKVDLSKFRRYLKEKYDIETTCSESPFYVFTNTDAGNSNGEIPKKNPLFCYREKLLSSSQTSCLNVQYKH